MDGFSDVVAVNPPACSKLNASSPGDSEIPPGPNPEPPGLRFLTLQKVLHEFLIGHLVCSVLQSREYRTWDWPGLPWFDDGRQSFGLLLTQSSSAYLSSEPQHQWDAAAPALRFLNLFLEMIRCEAVMWRPLIFSPGSFQALISCCTFCNNFASADVIV